MAYGLKLSSFDPLMQTAGFQYKVRQIGGDMFQCIQRCPSPFP